MLQRIQTVYYLIAALVLAAMFIFPIAAFDLDTENYYVLDVFGLKDHSGEKVDVPANVGMMIAIPFTVLLIVATIFMYRDRKRQMKFGRLIYLLLAGVLVGIYFIIRSNGGSLPEGYTELSYGPAYFFPLVSLIFVFLANRSVRKDEDLVRSLDRLR